MLRAHCVARTARIVAGPGHLAQRGDAGPAVAQDPDQHASGNQARMVSIWRRCSGVFSTTRRAPLAAAKLASSARAPPPRSAAPGAAPPPPQRHQRVAVAGQAAERRGRAVDARGDRLRARGDRRRELEAALQQIERLGMLATSGCRPSIEAISVVPERGCPTTKIGRSSRSPRPARSRRRRLRRGRGGGVNRHRGRARPDPRR